MWLISVPLSTKHRPPNRAQISASPPASWVTWAGYLTQFSHLENGTMSPAPWGCPTEYVRYLYSTQFGSFPLFHHHHIGRQEIHQGQRTGNLRASLHSQLCYSLSCAGLRYCYIWTLKKEPRLGVLIVQEYTKDFQRAIETTLHLYEKSTSQSSHFMDKDTDYEFASLSLTAKTWESWEENMAHTPEQGCWLRARFGSQNKQWSSKLKRLY